MIFQDIQSMDENKSWHSTFQYLNLKSREKAGSQKTGKSAANRVYNRYRDVIPYDHSLVRLRNSDTEYINANLVKVSSIDKKYILTQGPLPHTCKHFWEMVWEQNTYSIVMLNRVVEKNQLKCYQYWPLSGSITTESMKVTLKEEKDYREFVVRDLELENLKDEETRTVRHFHYVAWPDFGVPGSPQAFLTFLLNVQENESSINGAGPPVVHCSAGIGRSGTFALIDAALTEIKQKDDMMDYDVKKVLLEMRTYRPGLIQTTEQLRFSYIAILEGANMVAPAAYGSAYWKMAGQSESPEESEEDEPERPVKRIAGSDTEVNDEPKAKEPRKEEEPSESSESESSEEEIVNLSDEDNDSADVSGNEKDQEAQAVVEKDSKFASEHSVGQDEDFREEVRTVPTVKVTSEDEIKQESPEESDTEQGEKDEDNQQEPTQDKTSEFVVTEREIKTTTSITKDDPTNVDMDAAESRHEHLETNADEEHVESYSSSDITKSESQENDEGGNSSQFHQDLNMFNSEEDVGSSSVEKVVRRWQPGDGDSSESIGGSECEAPVPKRSAMRTNSSEGKRKSVTFMQKNDETEKGVEGQILGTEVVNNDSTDERKTESSILRKRQIEERKQKLHDKVDEIKKKMKKQEERDSLCGKAVIAGLVICIVVAGAAFFYYRYQS